MNQRLFDYIAACPTAFHTVAHTAKLLRDAGYTELFEGDVWALAEGGSYFMWIKIQQVEIEEYDIDIMSAEVA